MSIEDLKVITAKCDNCGEVKENFKSFLEYRICQECAKEFIQFGIGGKSDDNR